MDSPGTTHDLIRPRQPIALTADTPAPSWLGPALERAPWVVVRRGPVRDDMIPVGARGSARHQRFAAFLSVAEIAERLSPEDLVVILGAAVHDTNQPLCSRDAESSERSARPLWGEHAPLRRLRVAAKRDGVIPHIEQERRDAVPALVALARVAPVLARRGSRWGPGGSVGFEIATGVPTATSSSDLDLILRQESRLEPGEAGDLLAALAEAAAPARVDVMLETPTGGVSLADLAARPARLLVRTPDGPRLSVDPWIREVAS